MGHIRPKIVVTIHGINTHGKWQKSITPHLARHGLVPYHIDFGSFSLLRFLFGWTRNKQIDAVRDELRLLIHHSGVRRVSVIAHSFGTLIALESLLRENGNIKFDRVVLTGSILPLDLDWPKLLDEKKVMAVRNERAANDIVVSLAKFASKKYIRWITGLQCGDSGRQQFTSKHAALIDTSIVGGHSDAHNVTQFERWARFIAYPILSPEILEKVRVELQVLRQDAGRMLQHPVQSVRVNLFAPIDGALRIVPGAVDNMTYAPELDLKIEPDHGATGAAFQTGSPCIVVKSGQTWSGRNLPGDELDKIHPGLKWIVSLPVKSGPRGAVVGVINVDGLDSTPGILDDQYSVDCQAAVLGLFALVADRFVPCLEAAFRGEELSKVEV